MSNDEIFWRVSGDNSDLLDLHSGKQRRCKTLFAKAQRNAHDQRAIVSGRVAQIYAEDDQRLISERPFGPLVGFVSLIQGRYVVSEHSDFIQVLDLDDINGRPFRLNVSRASDFYDHHTNPFFRTNTVLGNVTATKMFELFANTNHSIELRKEWPISANGGRSFSKFGQSFFSLNATETLVEQRSEIDGELKATFPLPPVHPSFGATPPYWHLDGNILQMHSNDCRLNYAFDVVNQRELYTPADSPATPLLGWPAHQHIYFRHLLFRERNQLTIYHPESGDIRQGVKVPSSFEFGLELTDGRLALIGRAEGLTVQVLDPKSGAIQIFTPLRWVSHTIPFLILGLAICVYVMIVRSGQNKLLDCISIVIFLLTTLSLLALRLDSVLYLGDPLRLKEFQVYFALCASIVISSAAWLLLSTAHWGARLLPLVLATLCIAISTFFFPTNLSLKIQVGLFIALVIGMLGMAAAFVAARCFGFRIVSEDGIELERPKVRFAFGLKDIMSFTVCVAALCVGGKAVMQLEEYGWMNWAMCEHALLLNCVGAIAIAACLSHRTWFFRLGCTLALLSLFTLVFSECFAFYVGSGPIYSMCGWLHPNEFAFNLMNEFEDSGLWIANGVRCFAAMLAGMFGVAIGLRNYGWRLRRLSKSAAVSS